MEFCFAISAFICGCLAGLTATRSIQESALTYAISVCQTNQGIQAIETSVLGHHITGKCRNGASFEILNPNPENKQ